MKNIRIGDYSHDMFMGTCPMVFENCVGTLKKGSDIILENISFAISGFRSALIDSSLMVEEDDPVIHYGCAGIACIVDPHEYVNSTDTYLIECKNKSDGENPLNIYVLNVKFSLSRTPVFTSDNIIISGQPLSENQLNNMRISQ